MFKIMILTMLVASALTCPNEPYCQSCFVGDEEPTCEFCYQSILIGKHCKLVTKKQSVANCLLYGQKPGDGEQELECESCVFGFNIQAGKCDECKIKGCAICENVNSCTACDNGKKLTKNGEVLSCSEENSEIDNCEITNYSSEAKCEKCKKDFALDETLANKNACKETKIHDCWVLDSKKENECKVCNFGFYIVSQGKCKANETGNWFKWLLLVLVVLAVFAGIGYAVYRKKENDKPFSSEPLIN